MLFYYPADGLVPVVRVPLCLRHATWLISSYCPFLYIIIGMLISFETIFNNLFMAPHLNRNKSNTFFRPGSYAL